MHAGEPAKVGIMEAPGLSPRAYVLLIASLLLSEATGSFETATIFAAQRALNVHFGDPVLVGWLITSYLIVGAGAAALAGRLGDLYGRRLVLGVVLGCGIAGSLMSAMAPSYGYVFLGRCIQGVTGAILPLTIGLVREHVPSPRVPVSIGVMIAGASAGTAAGLVIGGMMVDRFGWQAVFLASAGFATAAAVSIFFHVPPSPPADRHGRVDWLGGVLFVPGILALLVPITYGATWGLFDPRTLGLATLGAALLAAWMWHSLRIDRPLFEVRLFANRSVAIANGVTALVAMSALQITLVFSVLLQAPRWTGIGLGVSATVAGLVKLPSNVSSLAAGPLSGWLTARGGGRMTMVAGGAICIIGWLLAIAFHETVFQLVIVLIIISFGTTVLFAVGPTIIAAAAPHDRTSEAAGIMTVTRQAFMGIGAQVISVILASDTVAGPGGARFPTAHAFMLAIGVIVAICAAATALALWLPRQERAG